MTTVKYIFAIRNKGTGAFLSFGSKVAWKTSGAAKNAWNCHRSIRYWCVPQGMFAEQDEWEVVDVLNISKEKE